MTEIKIDEHNLIDQLCAVFPEIEERYRKELQDWKDEPPGNYNILGFVFKISRLSTSMLRMGFEHPG
jgi:hypothetical protein